MIGKVPVRDVTTAHVVRVLEPIWLTKTETATRIRSRIELVLDFAAATGLREGANPARWRENPIDVIAQSADSAAIFGRFNVAIERVQISGAGSSNMDRLSNNRSDLGFRGSEDRGDGLKAIWQIAGSVAPDTGTGSIASRDSRIGLQGVLGGERPSS